MTLGSRIRDFRRKAGMTQRELGIAVGFSPLNADVRIAQYENGGRKPKTGILGNLATVFGISTAALNVPNIENRATLIYGETFLCVDALNGFEGEGLNDLLDEWQRQLAKLERDEITQVEYDHWRYNLS